MVDLAALITRHSKRLDRGPVQTSAMVRVQVQFGAGGTHAHGGRQDQLCVPAVATSGECYRSDNDGFEACGDLGVDGQGNYTGVYGNGGSIGVYGTGPTAVQGDGTSYGLYGSGGNTGVFAISGTYGVHGTSDSGSGVYGENSGSTGIGVEGKTAGVGSAVYGHATVNGVGVFGDTASGTGVVARSMGTGTALDVRGKAKFTRSGRVTVPSGANHVTVTLAGVTNGSMVLATVQQSGAFFVKNVALASGSFTIYLNKAPASPATVKVAYFVLN